VTSENRILSHIAVVIQLLIFTAIPTELLPIDLRYLTAYIAALLFTLHLTLPGGLWRSFAALLTFFSFVLIGWFGDYERMFGRIEGDTMLAVYQADQLEVVSYFIGHLELKVLLLSVIAAVALLVPPSTVIFRDGKRWSLGFSLTVLSLPLVVGSFFFNFTSLRERITVISQAEEIFAEQKRAQEEAYKQLTENESVTKLEETGVSASFEGTVVIVLLESVTSAHLSLYGYHRNTTPRLDSLRESLEIQTNTISPHSHTDPSLIRVLTPLANNAQLPLKDAFDHNLLRSLRRAGFKTFWFSNQNEFGLWDNQTSLLAKQANQYEFIRPSFGIFYRKGYYDEQLLALMREALDDSHPSKVITLHFYSAHTPYCIMLPDDHRNTLDRAVGLGEAFFGIEKDKSTETNCYDETILYVDALIAQVLEQAKDALEPFVVGVFADHGEAPALGTAHNAAKHSHLHVQIPHFWFFNEQARSVRSEKIETFKALKDSAYNIEDFYHSLLDFLVVDAPRLDSSRSLFSKDFIVRPRLTVPNIKEDFIQYDEREEDERKDSFERARVELLELKRKSAVTWRKFWVHRVNTLGKLLQVKQLFAGIELDLVFDEKARRFFVYHPPLENVGLTLEMMLQASTDYPELGVWADWKNATKENVNAALARFARLDAEYGLKSRILIETGHDAIFGELSALTRHGFKHAYYLPTEEIIECDSESPSENCETLSELLLTRVKTIGATAISYDARARAFIEAHTEQFQGLERFTWSSVDDKATLPAADTLGFSTHVVEGFDESVHLVRFHSPFDR